MIGFCRVLALLLLGGMTGCSFWFQRVPMTETSFTRSEADRSLEEAVRYIQELMAMPQASQRDAECKRLWSRHRQQEDQDIRVRLALSLLVSEKCVADASGKALSLLDEAMATMKHSGLRDFLAYHRELAFRLHQGAQQQRVLTGEISRLKKRNQGNLKQLEGCRGALKETRMKLEALKKIEKSLNHTEVQ